MTRIAPAMLVGLFVLGGCQTAGVSKDTRIYIDMLESSDPGQRQAAARALQLRRGRRDLRVLLPALIRALSDRDSEVRFYVLEAIRQQTGVEDFPADPLEARDYFGKHREKLLAATEVPPAERLRQTQAEIKNARGLQSMIIGEHVAAQNYFAEALALDFDNPAYHNNLGLAYFNQRRYKAALGKFEDAMALESTYTAAIMNAGRSYEMLAEAERDPKEAEELLQKAEDFLERTLRRDRRKTNWAARHVLSRVYFKQRKFEKAITTMEAAIRIMPDSPQLRVTFAIVYYGSEMYYSAWKQLVMVKRLGARPNPDFVNKLKDKLRETGQAESMDLTELEFPDG